jgi:ribonuclease HI
VREKDQQYLGFEWEGEYYVFTALPFGLASAPWCFTKVMLVVVRSLRAKGVRVIAYLDDFLFIIPMDNPAKAATIRTLVLNTFEAAGLTINLQKSTLEFTTRLEHLGFVVDLETGRFEVPPHRWDALMGLIKRALSTRRVQVRTLARITGHAVSMYLALGPVARMFTRWSYRVTSLYPMSYYLELPIEVRQELEFWEELHRTRFTTPVWREAGVAGCIINTDAGKRSWGAVFEGKTAQGSFSLTDREASSTLRELLAVFHTLSSFAAWLKGRQILLLCDNQAVERIIPAGSPHPRIQQVALDIFWLAEELGCRLQVEWVPREQNKEADAVTRWFDYDDWQLAPAVFAHADALWGPHSMDRFASHTNHVLARFNSLHHCPDTEGVNALAQTDWALHNNWCNPPFGLILDLLEVLRKFQAEASIVVPMWPSRPWWPMLLASPTHFRSFVRGCWLLPDSVELFRPGPSLDYSQALGKPGWRVMILRVSFRPAATGLSLTPVPCT